MERMSKFPGARATRAMAWIFVAPLALVVAAGRAVAQTSPSFRLEERVLNAGGHPAAGVILVSASFRLSLDSLGDGPAARGLGSTSFRLDASLLAAYPPPGEARNLRFLDGDTLAWDPEASAGSYNLYRDLTAALPAGGFGACVQQALATESADDAVVPETGQAFFYLVTVENRLAEEGTKGFSSDGGQRLGTACP